MTDSNGQGITIQDVIIDTLYVLAIGINVYIIVDQLSDGQVSRNLSVFYRTRTAKFTEWRRQRQEYRRSTGHVIWQAINIVENGDE